MTTDLNFCPRCGSRMRTRTSTPMGRLVRAYRECTTPTCTYRDVAKVEPARVLKVILVDTKLGRDSESHNANHEV